MDFNHNFLSLGVGAWRALSKSRFASMESKNALSTLDTIFFWEKMITSYFLALIRVEFLKFSFLSLKVSFLIYLKIVKIKNLKTFFRDFSFFICHFEQLMLYLAEIKGVIHIFENMYLTLILLFWSFQISLVGDQAG